MCLREWSFLVGASGSGKTVIGSRVSSLIHWELYDTDADARSGSLCAWCVPGAEAARTDMRPPDGAATGGRLQKGLRGRAFAAATGGCGSEGPSNPSLATA